MIRMEGAMELCRALQYQRFLKHLDISFNSLGRDSAVTLGNALLDNEVDAYPALTHSSHLISHYIIRDRAT